MFGIFYGIGLGEFFDFEEKKVVFKELNDVLKGARTMKLKGIIMTMISVVMMMLFFQAESVFAAKSATDSTYGVTIGNSDYVACGNCSGGSSHEITKTSISTSGQPNDGKITMNITVTMKASNSHTNAGYPNPITIPYTVDVTCDKSINLTKQTISNSAGYKLNYCTVTKAAKAHKWQNGKCSVCGKSCSHSSWANGKCTTCSIPHSGHTWSSSTGKCTVCGLDCSHSWSSSTGKCTVCGIGCSHSWSSSTGKCTVCGIGCSHSWSSSTGKCIVCGIGCSHKWENGVCGVCGLKCGHSWSSSTGKCTVCGIDCIHKWTKDGCAVCGKQCTHSYSNNVCTNCSYSNFSYIDCVWNNGTKKLDVSTKNINDLVTVVTSGTTSWKDGWYVVRDNVTVNGRINVSGTVHLLLCDGATLNANRGISVVEGNSFYIYSQSENSTKTGKLIATLNENSALSYSGIGGNKLDTANAGTITINGGFITASGGTNERGHLCFVCGAGIGGGKDGNGGTVIINGGTVNAIGGTSSYVFGIQESNHGEYVKGGAGIGGGSDSNGGTVIINGGNVYAIGGRIISSGINSNAPAIGRGGFGSSDGTLKNGSGSDVSLRTYTLDGITEQTGIASVEGVSYGVNFYTLDTNKLYVYISSGDNITRVTTVDGRAFAPKNAGDTTLYCAHAKADGDNCAHCGDYLKRSEPVLKSKRGYHIQNLQELMWFADYVNDGNTNVNAILNCDIDASMAPNLKIGTSDNPYSGTFDGSVLYKITVELGDGACSALFPYVNGATISRLLIDGSVTTSAQNASGLVGCVLGGDVKIENCVSNVEINTNVNGDGTHGGFVGKINSGSLTINNCGFFGKIVGKSTKNCGGFVGWAGASVKINNSVVAAKEFNINATDESNTFARNPGKVNINNCYYLDALGSVPSGATKVEKGQITSGELAYLLNGSIGGGIRWVQNIDNGKEKEEYPVPNGANRADALVYYGYKDCATEEATITNSKIKKTIKGHNGGKADCLKPGYCVDCGEAYIEIDPNVHATNEIYYKYIDENIHGVYHSCCNTLFDSETHNGEASCTNSAYCSICKNSYGQTNENAHTEGQKWVDTGYGTHEFKYECCGAVTETEEHKITCTADDETDVISVVCEVCNGNGGSNHCDGNGTVALSVDGKVYDGKAVVAKYSSTGFMDRWNKPAEVSLEYCCEGGCKNAGTHTVKLHVGDVTVEKEFVIEQKPLTITKIKAFNKSYDRTSDVFVNSIDLDGIVIYEKADYAVFDIKDNVEVDLSKLAVNVSDSVPGYYEKASITNITLMGSDKDNYSIADTVDDVEIKCDWGDLYQIYSVQIWIMPDDQTLYGDDEKIDQTAYSVEGLDEEYKISGEFLYENADLEKICVNKENIKITYNDTDVTNYFDIADYYMGNVTRYCKEHIFNENGFCSTGECDSYDKPTLNDNGTAEYDYDDYYEIRNAGQLYWFAKQVNDYSKNSINGKLMADIKINDDLNSDERREWIPIGKDSSHSFYGNFDGNGYKVSGIYCKNIESNAGLFGSLGYYYVTDLHIANSYFEGKYAGAFAGMSDANISRCSVGADVTVIGTENAGGFAGTTNGSITNCYSLANVSGGIWGGLVGKSSSAIKNCYTTSMQPVGLNNSNYGGSFENVYYATVTRDYTDEENGKVTVKPVFEGATEISDFGSGYLAYKLQQGVDEETGDENTPSYVPKVWGQKIGKDSLPKISEDTVYEDEYNDEKLYRNEIDGFEIVKIGEDKKSVMAILKEAGTYKLLFVDYDDEKLVNTEIFDVAVLQGQAVKVVLTKDFTLGTGDKIMLWNDFETLMPLCKAYEVE